MNDLIFIAEDDPNISLGLTELLTREGFRVATADHGDQVEQRVLNESPSLLILDIMMPGKDGFEVCRSLRQHNADLPILMLSAKGQEADKVQGLTTGADDYMTKPFGVQEIVARVHALLRRSRSTNTPQKEIHWHQLTIDPARFKLTNGQTEHDLTEKELALLQRFIAQPDIVQSRDQLLTDIWGYNYQGTTRTLDQVIVQLRKKISDTTPPSQLLTVHGIGYKWAS